MAWLILLLKIVSLSIVLWVVPRMAGQYARGHAIAWIDLIVASVSASVFAALMGWLG